MLAYTRINTIYYINYVQICQRLNMKVHRVIGTGSPRWRVEEELGEWEEQDREEGGLCVAGCRGKRAVRGLASDVTTYVLPEDRSASRRHSRYTLGPERDTKTQRTQAGAMRDVMHDERRSSCSSNNGQLGT